MLLRYYILFRYDVVIRQTFYGGQYSLIDRNLDPYPDYWLSLLYKRLVGSRTLDLTVNSSIRYVRAYAACTKYVFYSVTISIICISLYIAVSFMARAKKMRLAAGEFFICKERAFASLTFSTLTSVFN